MVNYETIPTRIIRPSKRGAKELCCSFCKISYSSEDYEILFANKKIVYFNFLYKNKKADKKNVICHDCLFNICHELIKDLDLDGVVIYVRDIKDKDYTMTIDRKGSK